MGCSNLSPLSISPETLPKYLEELRTAVRNGAEIVRTNHPLPEEWGVAGMMVHFPGKFGATLVGLRSCVVVFFHALKISFGMLFVISRKFTAKFISVLQTFKNFWRLGNINFGIYR